MGAQFAIELGKQVAQGTASQLGASIGNVGANYIQRGLDGIFGIDRDGEQVEQQRKLTQIQIDANKQLADYTQGLNKEMYDYTYNKNTPEAMRRNYEEAGMNGALAYGMGATNVGGTTTGGASAGSATGATASDTASRMQAETARQGMALQLATQQANIELMKSQTEKNKAEADKTSGIDTEKTKQEAALLYQNTEIAKEQKYINEIDADFAYQLKIATVDNIISQKLVNISKEEYVKENTKLATENIKKIKQEVENLRETKNLTIEQTKQVKQLIAESVAKISLMSTEERRNIANATETELNNILLKDVTNKIGGTELKIGTMAMPLITTIVKSLLSK